MHISKGVKFVVLLQPNQQMHTLEQNNRNILISKLLNIPSSGSAQLYKTTVQPFCHSQYVETVTSLSMHDYRE